MGLFQVVGQTMNTMGAVACSVGAYTYEYICLYTYIMLSDAYTVCIYYGCISLKITFVRATK
jgi:hypothetical protein